MHILRRETNPRPWRCEVSAFHYATIISITDDIQFTEMTKVYAMETGKMSKHKNQGEFNKSQSDVKTTGSEHLQNNLSYGPFLVCSNKRGPK